MRVNPEMSCDISQSSLRRGGNLDLKQAGLGGVAYEVGTLRMSANGVVDTNLKFLNDTNLYACDLFNLTRRKFDPDTSGVGNSASRPPEASGLASMERGNSISSSNSLNETQQCGNCFGKL
ncbi:hypothetical protein H6F43_11525 [Leptolyngbya sp. FACHB-36]|nr:hypothetical protein [Leptolyngbya sp. FACHB-36]